MKIQLKISKRLYVKKRRHNYAQKTLPLHKARNVQAVVKIFERCMALLKLGLHRLQTHKCGAVS